MNDQEITTVETTFDRLLSVILVILLVVAFCVTVFVISAPKENERFSDFFVLGESKTAQSYPDLVFSGQNYPIYIGVGNHEQQEMSYNVEIWHANTVFDSTTNTTSILSMDPANTLPLSLENNQTLTIPYNLTLSKTGYNRVVFLLFKGAVPAPEITLSDRVNASYRDLYVRISVR